MDKKEQIVKEMNENPIYDLLTGIANNFYFFEKFDDFLEKSRVDNKKGAFIYLDIDNYKVINDTLGHTIGDLALKMFSHLINYIIKDNCLFARLNGDEFIGEGFNIAIDDFGTGYSSLSYLINITVNTVKIDKIFIDNIENYKNKALVKSILDLSQIFKYKVITEGVETKEQMKEVTNLGCNIIQGYYYSKPLSNKDFEEYIKTKGVLK